MTFRSDILVFGSGECALEAAGRLSAQGMGVIMAAPPGSTAAGVLHPVGPHRVRVVDGTRWVGCRGQAGAFEAIFNLNGNLATYPVAAVVVAEEALCTPNFSDYGLEPSERVIALSEMEAQLKDESAVWPPARGKQVVFLNSWHKDSHPAIAARMLRLCRRMQIGGACRTAYLTGNLKVSADGMEVCCQQARAAGTLFLKFSSRAPQIETLNDGRIRIDYWDETTRMAFRLTADYAIVDESIQAHPGLVHPAELLRLDCDAAGYLQSDNVRRLSHLTNRRGIFAAGGARGPFVVDQQRAEAARVAQEVIQFLCDSYVDPHPVMQPGVKIDQGRCARCLTCYRLCPHAAIETTPRMAVVAQACQACGLCAAACPNQAIQVDDPELKTALQLLRQPPLRAPEMFPRIAAFCCRRSAVQAREWALGMGHRLPPGMVFIEGLCGGSFSVHHLLSAFEAGMDGVMLLTCHSGNCHCESGTTHAAKRSAQVTETLAAAGIEPERLSCGTLAANMGVEFARMAEAFSARIAALGPLYGS
jgi:quinone-modifying oxidoreductase, subunit QmoB